MSGFEVEKESNFCRIYRLSSSACQLASLSAVLGWAVLFKEDGTDLAASFGLLLSSKVGLVVQATAVTLAAIYACRKSGLSKCRSGTYIVQLEMLKKPVLCKAISIL